MGRNKKNHEAYWCSQIQASNVLGALVNELFVHLYNIGNVANRTNNDSIKKLCDYYYAVKDDIRQALIKFDIISDHLGLFMYTKDRIKNKDELTLFRIAEKDLVANKKNLFDYIKNNIQKLNYIGNLINNSVSAKEYQTHNNISNSLNDIRSSINNCINNTNVFLFNHVGFNYIRNKYTDKDIKHLNKLKYCVNTLCKNKQLNNDKESLKTILKLEKNDKKLDIMTTVLKSNDACSNYVKLINTIPNSRIYQSYARERSAHSAVIQENNKVIDSIIRTGKIATKYIDYIKDAHNDIPQIIKKCNTLKNTLINANTSSTYNESNLGRPIRSASYDHDNRNLRREESNPQIRQGQPRQGQFAQAPRLKRSVTFKFK